MELAVDLAVQQAKWADALILVAAQVSERVAAFMRFRDAWGGGGHSGPWGIAAFMPFRDASGSTCSSLLLSVREVRQSCALGMQVGRCAHPGRVGQ